MKNSSFFNLRKISFKDPVYYYIFTAACMVFFHISLEPYVHVYYQYTFIIPCMMFLGAMLERKEAPVYTKRFVLPGIMAVWFLLLQGKRGIDAELIADIGLFLSVYLFAFPLASLLQDGETKKGLTLFA